MTWLLLFCAWTAKSGGCITPTSLPSRAACEFVRKHQTDVAKGRDREWGEREATVITSRCVGVRP